MDAQTKETQREKEERQIRERENEKKWRRLGLVCYIFSLILFGSVKTAHSSSMQKRSKENKGDCKMQKIREK